jgi:hypothetical protein
MAEEPKDVNSQVEGVCRVGRVPPGGRTVSENGAPFLPVVISLPGLVQS